MLNVLGWWSFLRSVIVVWVAKAEDKNSHAKRQHTLVEFSALVTTKSVHRDTLLYSNSLELWSQRVNNPAFQRLQKEENPSLQACWGNSEDSYTMPVEYRCYFIQQILWYDNVNSHLVGPEKTPSFDSNLEGRDISEKTNWHPRLVFDWKKPSHAQTRMFSIKHQPTFCLYQMSLSLYNSAG